MSDKLKDLGKQLIKYSYEEIPNEKFKNNLELYDFLKELLKDVSEEDYNNLYAESLELINKLKTIPDEKFLQLSEELSEKYAVLMFVNLFQKETSDSDKYDNEYIEITDISYNFNEMVLLLTEKYDPIEQFEFWEKIANSNEPLFRIQSLYFDLSNARDENLLEKKINEEEGKLEKKYQEKKALCDISKMTGPEVAYALTQDFLTGFPSEKFNDEIEMLYCWNKTLETLTTKQLREILNQTFSVMCDYLYYKEERVEEFYALSDELLTFSEFFHYMKCNMNCDTKDIWDYEYLETMLHSRLLDGVQIDLMNYFTELADNNADIKNWNEIATIKQQDEQWEIFCNAFWNYNKFRAKRCKIGDVEVAQLQWKSSLCFKNKQIEIDLDAYRKVFDDWRTEQVDPFYEILRKRETENETC